MRKNCKDILTPEQIFMFDKKNLAIVDEEEFVPFIKWHQCTEPYYKEQTKVLEEMGKDTRRKVDSMSQYFGHKIRFNHDLPQDYNIDS